MQLAHPEYLWLFLIFLPLIGWYIWKHRNAYPAMEISSTSPYAKLPRSYKEFLLHGLFLLRLATIGCLIIVLARPQTRDSWRTSSTEGTDIIIALDISSSMLARDFKPDRFEAAKDVASKFVAGRETDNIGVVIFAGESFTAVPMTTDRSLLANYIHDIKMGMLEDGTAIGDGLATSINRIKDGKAKSKSIILITDGTNNTGNVAPLTAAEIAKKFDIKVYTIGVGKNGMAPMPQQNYYGGIDYVNMPVVIDEATLQSIASTTGGKYFRATSNTVLKEIFSEIDQLEKTQMDVRHFSHTEDNYMMWAWLAIGFFLLEILLRHTLLRTIP
ncbi:MAG: VWA domain-containing protein [Bacteroides sp.]|nr:VWA domain-containing protein [Lachnospiraceae bacterium]MCM1332485.1 VWA domain-containing protein [Bacteroides sp.]MCM1389765.1 VWA domain-containing protein [Bacteroides sp.]